MTLRPGDVYVRRSGDMKQYRVKAVSEVADFVVLEAADGTKVLSTFRDFETLFTKRRM